MFGESVLEISRGQWYLREICEQWAKFSLKFVSSVNTQPGYSETGRTE